MGISASIICNYPNILLFSLEKRIVPRFAVMQVLMSRCVIQKQLNLYTLLVGSELNFLNKFVTKYEEVVPELLMAYQGKGEHVMLELGSEEVGRAVKL